MPYAATERSLAFAHCDSHGDPIRFFGQPKAILVIPTPSATSQFYAGFNDIPGSSSQNESQFLVSASRGSFPDWPMISCGLSRRTCTIGAVGHRERPRRTEAEPVARFSFFCLLSVYLSISFSAVKLAGD